MFKRETMILDEIIRRTKEDLEKRIVHYLATGEELNQSSVKRIQTDSVSEITLNSKLGENFKCSEDKRAFFEKEIGKVTVFKESFQIYAGQPFKLFVNIKF